MTAAKKIINETKVRLKHGNMPVLVGAFSFVLMGALVVFLLFNLSEIIRLGIFKNTSANMITSGLCDALAFAAAFFLLPLLQGFVGMTYACAKGEGFVFSDLFYYYQSFMFAMRAIEIQMMLFLRFILGAAVVATLIVALEYAVSVLTMGFDNSVLSIFLKSVEVTVIILIILLFIDFLFRYFLAAYIFCDNDFENASFCIKNSVRIMKSFRLEAVRLVLSTFHLFLLSLLVVPLLYTVPKLMTTFSVSAKWIIAAQNYDS